MSGINGIKGTDKTAWDPTFGLSKNNDKNKVGAQVAFINTDDFMKKGYVAPPGLTEGGSCFNPA